MCSVCVCERERERERESRSDIRVKVSTLAPENTEHLTHRPDLEDEEIAFSAKLKPSADPERRNGRSTMCSTCCHWALSPMAMDVHCLLCWVARSSTLPLAS